MSQPCPTPASSALWEEARAAIDLLVEWDRRTRDPGETPARVHESCLRFAAALEALGRRVAAAGWLAAEDRAAWEGAMTAFLAWSAAHQPHARHALMALPREALAGLQNLGRAAFMAGLARTLMESPHRERFQEFADRVRKQYPGGSDVRPSDAVSLLNMQFEDDARVHPVFASMASFESYLRIRLEAKVRDEARAEAARDRREARHAEQLPDADRETPSGLVAGAEFGQRHDRERGTIEERLAVLSPHRQTYWFLRMRQEWPFTRIAEAFLGASVRPDLTTDPVEGGERATRRNSSARAIKRDLEKVIDWLACGDEGPPPPDDGPVT